MFDFVVKGNRVSVEASELYRNYSLVLKMASHNLFVEQNDIFLTTLYIKKVVPFPLYFSFSGCSHSLIFSCSHALTEKGDTVDGNEGVGCMTRTGFKQIVERVVPTCVNCTVTQSAVMPRDTGAEFSRPRAEPQCLPIMPRQL